MTAYRDQAALALRAAAVASPSSISWFGRRSRAVPAGGLLPARTYLVHELEGTLYRAFYTQGAPMPVTGVLQASSPPAPSFVDALSRVNVGRGGWQAGWRIVRAEPPGLVVARDGLLVHVPSASCRQTDESTVSLPRSNEDRAASPGFYTALGDAVPALGDDDVEVRVYFHLTAAGAAPLVASCTRVLNGAAVPFVLKVVDNPAAFMRCDAGVLYLGDFPRDGVREVVAACRPYLRADAPAFAKPLTGGVAVGEHRAALGGSFGSSRCRLVAEGIVDAYERRARSLDARLEAVERRFGERDLSLDAPYLVPGSVDGYAL